MQRPVSLMSSEAFVYHLKITDIDYRYRVLIPAGVLQCFPQLQAEGGIVHSSRHSIHKGDILQTPSVVPVYKKQYQQKNRNRKIVPATMANVCITYLSVS